MDAGRTPERFRRCQRASVATMKAAVLYETKKPLVVEDVDLAAPRHGEVLVKIGAAGVCHSDYHFMNGDLPIGLPAVLGHEGAGVVESIGEGVTTVKPGDHVVLLFRPNCGHCEFCSRGRPALCWMAGQLRNTGHLLDGTSRLSRNGEEIKHFLGVSCFAERAVVPEQGVVPISADVPLEVAALVGCAVMTGVGAVMNTARVTPGASALVIGAGGIGLNCIMGLRLVGAHPIIAADISDAKLETATEFGATHVVNARSIDVVEGVREATAGEGVEFAFEAIGNPKAMSQSFAALRRGGVATAVGIAPWGSEMSISAGELVYQEKTLKGSYYGGARPQHDMPRLLALYRTGQLPIDRLISRRYQLHQVNEAYEALLRGEVARSVLLP
jgi:S-(hydroxymethyl)glutathione dehydrogenase / alcohol dehydrogenase